MDVNPQLASPSTRNVGRSPYRPRSEHRRTREAKRRSSSRKLKDPAACAWSPRRPVATPTAVDEEDDELDDPDLDSRLSTLIMFSSITMMSRLYL